jgi:hypothetical protein
MEERGAEDVSPMKLLSLFGVGVGNLTSLIGQSEEIAWMLVAKVVTTELHTRPKLSDVNTLEDAVKLIQKSKNIMVVTGAGVSLRGLIRPSHLPTYFFHCCSSFILAFLTFFFLSFARFPCHVASPIFGRSTVSTSA